MNTQLPLNRRRVLQGLGVAAATAASGVVPPLGTAFGVPAPAEPQDTAPARPEPTLHVYRDYGWLRGFNVVPSWGARGEDAWWFYDGQKMRDEVALARQVHETIPGSLDDAVRAEGAKYYTELLGEAEFGWLGWALREGIAISTRRDRIDGNGFRGDGFHPFFAADGSLRPGLEFLREKPARAAPWEKA